MKNNTKYTQLTRGERITIKHLLKAGFSHAKIAKELGRHRSTILREVARGSEEVEVEIKTTKKYLPLTEKKVVYNPLFAQKLHDEKRQESCRHFKIFNEPGYIEFIEDLILKDKRRFSPDTANALARENGFKGVSTKTLYTWIHWNLLRVKKMDLLLTVGRKQTPKEEVAKRNQYGKNISERPELANNRMEFGHWEGDSIVSGQAYDGHAITLVERKLRVGLIFKFDKKRAENMVVVLNILKERYGEMTFEKIFKSITFDNGSEFAYNEAMSKFCKIYYANAYRSCERASNENYNGMVRRFIPKGSDLTKLTQEDMDRINHWINTMPRKLLGYKTPLELFQLELAA